MRFRATRRGIQAKLEPVEAGVLAQCATDLLELLGEQEAPDPFAQLLAGEPAVMAETHDVRRPDDPALARLLPDAYSDDSDELRQASAEFRRYTEADLRAGKRSAAGTVLATLPPGGGTLLLDREQADAWLGCLNDLRLVLGARLEVTEETALDDLAEDDPSAPALQLYGWLGYVQESLLAALMSRRP